jgi:hypothetical protein
MATSTVIVTRSRVRGDAAPRDCLSRKKGPSADGQLLVRMCLGASSSGAASKRMIGFGNPLLDGPDAGYSNRAKLAREHQRCSDGGSQWMAAIVGHRGGGSCAGRSALAANTFGHLQLATSN